MYMYIYIYIYDAALKQAGYKDKIHYIEKQTTLNVKRKRHRKVIWFNPPCIV